MLALAVRGRNVLVAGDPKSGKSWVTGLLCEQLILYGYCLCIIDPEGDYTSLEALPGVVVFGGADPLPRPRDLLRALRHPDGSVVIDLSHCSHEEKLDYVRTILPSLATLRRLTGLPHRIVVDEAHYFLHGSNVDQLLDLELNSYTLATYRASELHPNVLSASQAIVVTRESDPAEARSLRTLCAGCSGPLNEHQWEQLLERLVIGEAVVLPITDETGGQARHIRLAPASRRTFGTLRSTSTFLFPRRAHSYFGGPAHPRGPESGRFGSSWRVWNRFRLPHSKVICAGAISLSGSQESLVTILWRTPCGLLKTSIPLEAARIFPHG